MPRKCSLFSVLLVLLSFLPLSGAHAQSATAGAISGTVSDASGAVLPGATVKVTNSATGDERTVKTGKSGDFRIPELQPGVYGATVTMDGFQTAQIDIITVTVGGVANITPKLVVGSVSDKVEVTGEAPDVHTSGAEISTTIDQNTIDNLPINGRRWSDFALLTPGVVSNSDGFGLLSFRGISYLLNNTTVDGADDNQAYFSEARGRTRSQYTVSQGAVQEFQVNTSNYSAEYGRAAGGVINTVTKSGSNKLHGELFFYDRDNGLGGASNPYTQLYNFSQTTGLNIQNIKPKDWRKQWGFGIGGSILKDKIFWFYAFDESRRNFPGIARTSDPYDLFATATPLSGKESCSSPAGNNFGAPYASYTSPDGTYVNNGFAITGNLSTPALVSATTRPYPTGQSFQGNFGACALAVAIAGSTGGTPTVNYEQGMAYYNQGLGILASFFGPVPRVGNQVINFPKIDYQINDRNRLTVQYNRLRWDSPNGVQTQTSNFYGRGSYGNDFVKADVGIVRLSTVVTNSVVNSFLAQYGRDMESEFPSTTLPNELPLVNPLSTGECSAPHSGGCLAGAPDLSVGFGYDAAGFDAGTSALFSRFALPDERRIQLKDDVTWSHGKHSFKLGLDFNKVSDYINNLYNGYGTYDFDWAYSFIGDYLHKTTGLGGTGYAGGNGTPFNSSSTDYNFGLYSSYSQGYTVPQNYNETANTGTPDNVGASALIATREYAGYATDDWRMTPKLTVTLGVRYEYEYVPANPTPNPDFVGVASVGKYKPDTTARPDDRNNVQPRLGFALNVFGDSKTMLRGGYGMYFGRIINANIEQSYQNSGGPGSQVNISGLFPDATTSTLANCKIVFPQTVPTYTQAIACAHATNNASSHPSISYLDNHLQNPQVHEADLALEQDLGHDLVLGVTYMSSFGRELDSANDVNLNLATSIPNATYYVNNTPQGPGIRNPVLPHGGKPAPLPGVPTQLRVYSGTRNNASYYRILRIASNVNSNYNALAFQINKRYRNGFSLLSNFTWAHALDFNPYIGTGIPGPSQLDPNDQSKDYGNSSLDVRRRFVAAFTYQPQTHFHGYKDALFGGWRLAPIVQIQSGLPYTPYINGYPLESASGVRSANGAGGTSGRIDAIRRNQYTRPKSDKADVRLGKNFYFNVNKYGIDRPRLEFFAEVFNVANHQNITGIQNTAYNLSGQVVAGVTPAQDAAHPNGFDTLTLQPNFGTYNNSNSNYTYTPRQLQVAVRLHF
ncbi:MAG TPA: TonB-dependent receptor [Acidobacteriaceae bacterium]|nr:TonB-dependent receptor [Acidobacteriaceae bacterium]